MILYLSYVLRYILEWNYIGLEDIEKEKKIKRELKEVGKWGYLSERGFIFSFLVRGLREERGKKISCVFNICRGYI